jgi:hypothetical protein
VILAGALGPKWTLKYTQSVKGLRRHLIAVVLGLLANSLFTQNASGETFSFSTTTSGTAAYGASFWGQTFTIPAGRSGQISSISNITLNCYASSTLTTSRLRIYDSPFKNNLLGTATNDFSGPSCVGGWGSATNFTGNFTNLNVTEGVQYFLELQRLTGSGNFYFYENGSNPYSGGASYVNGTMYPAYDLKFTVNMESNDTTAPTFTSSTSFSAAENIATSATAATIRVSESATVTISSGADAARFNIARSETNTAIIKFNATPDFEAPADVGGNNVYEITLTATDAAANAGTQSITITVTDVVDTSGFNSLALAGSATTATYRTAVAITANVTVASRVTFTVNGKVLPGCKNKSTTGSSPNIVATCSWRPSNRGVVSLTASAAPTGAGISSSTSTPLSIMVGNRTGTR